MTESFLHLLSLSSKSVQSTPCPKRFSMCFFLVQGLDLCGWCKSTTFRLSKCYYFAAARHCWKSIQQVTWNLLKICEFILFVMLVYWSLFFLTRQLELLFVYFPYSEFIWKRHEKMVWFSQSNSFVWVALSAAWGHGTVGRICFFWRWTSIIAKHVRLLYAFDDVISIKFSTAYWIMICRDMICRDLYLD